MRSTASATLHYNGPIVSIEFGVCNIPCVFSIPELWYLLMQLSFEANGSMYYQVVY